MLHVTVSPNWRSVKKRINFVKSSRVLGLVIDEELSFYKHAGKTLQRCWFSWYKITRSSNRNYGLNISSMAILFKTVVLTKLLYAAPVWLNAQNQLKFKSFFARACLKISGCTHYTPQSISLLIMGLEPLEMLYNIVCTKFIRHCQVMIIWEGLYTSLKNQEAIPFTNILPWSKPICHISMDVSLIGEIILPVH